MECGFERDVSKTNVRLPLGHSSNNNGKQQKWAIGKNNSKQQKWAIRKHRPLTEDKTLDVSAWWSSQTETNSNCLMLSNASLNLGAYDSNSEKETFLSRGIRNYSIQLNDTYIMWFGNCLHYSTHKCSMTNLLTLENNPK